MNSGDLKTAEMAWEGELKGCASEGRPIIPAKYGADVATTSGAFRVEGNKNGVTRDRQRKAAGWALRRRWRRDG